MALNPPSIHTMPLFLVFLLLRCKNIFPVLNSVSAGAFTYLQGKSTFSPSKSKKTTSPYIWVCTESQPPLF